jgi:hypothetical protein
LNFGLERVQKFHSPKEAITSTRTRMYLESQGGLGAPIGSNAVQPEDVRHSTCDAAVQFGRPVTGSQRPRKKLNHNCNAGTRQTDITHCSHTQRTETGSVGRECACQTLSNLKTFRNKLKTGDQSIPVQIVNKELLVRQLGKKKTYSCCRCL